MQEIFFSIFKLKKLFFEKEIDVPKINSTFIKFVESFKNGNILVVNLKSFSLFDNTFNLIYQYSLLQDIIALAYINRKQFIILDKSGIHLFSESFTEEFIFRILYRRKYSRRK